MNAHSDTDRWRSDERHAPSSGYIPTIVAGALDRYRDAHDHAAALPTRTDADHATRASRLAALAVRAARWWDVLAAWAYSPAGTVPLVFGAAAVAAASSARDDARFWREAAADWHARATGVPTSDAAGALSNHFELGLAQ